jgi:hypothetical protein
MNRLFPQTLLSVLSAFLLCQPASAALIASWDFDTGTSADLTSNVGGYTLGAVGDTGGVTYAAGSLSLTQNAGLFALGVNSGVLPQLQDNATLYARVKFDTATDVNGGFFLGLVDATGFSDFFQQSLTAFAYNATNVAAYGFTSAGHAGENSAFAGGGLLPATDVYFTIALVLTGGNNWRLNINGVDVSNLTATGTEMQAFQSLGFGRLKNSHGIAAMTFDTVQLYDTSLTAAEIAAIPEPGSLGLLVGGVGLALARRRARA